MGCGEPGASPLCPGDGQLPAVAGGQERGAGFQPEPMPRADLAQSQGCSRDSLPTVTPSGLRPGTRCVPGTCCFGAGGFHCGDTLPTGARVGPTAPTAHPAWGGFLPLTFQNGFNCSPRQL